MRFIVRETNWGFRVFDTKNRQWHSNTFEDEGTAKQCARNLDKTLGERH